MPPPKSPEIACSARRKAIWKGQLFAKHYSWDHAEKGETCVLQLSPFPEMQDTNLTQNNKQHMFPKVIRKQDDRLYYTPLWIPQNISRPNFQHLCLLFRPRPYLTWPTTCVNSTGLNDRIFPRLDPHPFALSEAEPRCITITTRGDLNIVHGHHLLQTWRSVHEQRSRSVHERETVTHRSERTQTVHVFI